MDVIYFQLNQWSKIIEIKTTSDPKILVLTCGDCGFIVDVYSGKVIQKVNTVLPTFSNQCVITRRNGNKQNFRLYHHTGKCIRRFAGIYAYCRYFIDRK